MSEEKPYDIKKHLPLVPRGVRGDCWVDSANGNVWVGAQGDTDVRDFIVLACNNYLKLLAACQAAEEALAGCYDVTEWPATPDCKEALALSTVRAAIRSATGEA